MEKAVELSEVSFSFGGPEVLSDISFIIEKGDFIGLIGPNGSGKTTLLKLMLGLYSLKSGSIKLFGSEISRFTSWSKVGYVPQKATNIDSSFPATVREVVAMGLLSRKRFPKMMSPGDWKKIGKALKTVGMEEFENRRIGELSGGQQQRVYIARAIVSEPQILFLDEPTTGVDQQTQESFYDLLGELNTKGITIVLVSHDIGRITRHVTKIASLNKFLEFYGTHKDFCAYDKGHDHRYESHALCMDWR